MSLLPKCFYTEPKTKQIAQNLLGKILVRKLPSGKIINSMIVETEAYLQDDPACHASRGETKRTKPMFQEGGISYVYMIYGMYYCFNVVTQTKGVGEAVLIRAVEPLNNNEYLFKNRSKIKDRKNLTNGPGKLCQALEIDLTLNEVSLTDKKNSIYILDAPSVNSEEIVRTTRVGINQAQDRKLRFYIKDNHFVSKVKS